MSTLTPMIEAWVEGHREFAISLEGLPDEDLWKRPHPKLLSVGEIASHIAYAQAVWIIGEMGDKTDLSTLSIQSPIVDHAVRYYPYAVETPFHVEMGTNEVLAEVQRVHQAAKEALADKEKDQIHAYWDTWGNLMQYQAFHIAYHTGQIYSVRHLLGHEPPHN